MKCENCGNEILEGTVCPICLHENAVPIPEEVPAAPQPQLTMKWYKVLKVLLWITIVANIYSAYTFFSGSVYQGFASQVYA